MKILVTGGCGFIGSNLVRHIIRSRPEATVVNLDNLSYAGNLESLKDLEGDPRHRFVHGDIRDRALVSRLLTSQGIDAVIHLAAESHVDRSIMAPEVFTETNVVGTSILLEACRAAGVARFVHVSTDEVYGSLGPTGASTEAAALCPSSPYSASKAGADLLVLAYHHTFKMDVLVSRCSNNYGPYQFPEKLIPLMIANALADSPLPVYGDGMHVREWLHVDDHVEALWAIFEKGRAGEVYNVGSGLERPNIDIVKRILRHLGKPDSLIRYITDRPGHDRRYALDASKLRTELGWAPRYDFESGLRSTIDWYVSNRAWWEHITSGEYRNYYERAYRDRLQAAATK